MAQMTFDENGYPNGWDDTCPMCELEQCQCWLFDLERKVEYSMSQATQAQVTAAFKAVIAVAECIRELKTVPSGELYARLMDRMTIEDYNAIIRILKKNGMITDEFYLLTWIGD
jgi:hypothetical protein